MKAHQLKNAILQLAVQGKLVPQNPNDEPACKLLERIAAEKRRRIKTGEIKKDKRDSTIVRRGASFYEIANTTERCIDDELPFVIPESWEWVYLGSISFITKLAGFEYTNYIAPALTSHGIPLFKGKNIQNGKLIEHFEGFIPETVSDELWRSQLTKRCLLTPYVGSIGNVAVFPGTYKAHLGSNVGKIEPYSDNGVLIEYILYYLRSVAGYEQLTKHKKATAQESISIEAIRNVLMPIPPLAEQRRIVDRLESLLPLVEAYGKAEAELSQLDARFPDMLKKSILQDAVQGKLVPQNPNDEPASVLLERIRAEKQRLIKEKKIKREKNPSVIFKGADNTPYEKIGDDVRSLADEVPFDIPDSWEWVRLKNFCIDIFSGKSPKYVKRESNYHIIGQAANQNDGLDFSKCKYTNVDFWNSMSEKYFIKKYDVLLNTLGNGTLGRSGIVLNLPYAVLTDGHLFVLRTGDKILSWYLYLYLQYRKTDIERTANGSTDQTFLSLTKTMEWLIPIPPLAEQRRIVDRIESLFSTLSIR